MGNGIFRRLRGHNNNNSSSEKHSLVAKEQQQDIESGMGGKWRRRENKNTAQNATKAAKVEFVEEDISPPAEEGVGGPNLFRKCWPWKAATNCITG